MIPLNGLHLGGGRTYPRTGPKQYLDRKEKLHSDISNARISGGISGSVGGAFDAAAEELPGVTELLASPAISVSRLCSSFFWPLRAFLTSFQD